MARIKLTPWRIAGLTILTLLIISYLLRVTLLNTAFEKFAPQGWQVQVQGFELSFFELELRDIDIHTDGIGDISVDRFYTGGIDRFRFTSAILNSFQLQGVSFDSTAQKATVESLQISNIALDMESPGFEQLQLNGLTLSEQEQQLNVSVDDIQLAAAALSLPPEEQAEQPLAAALAHFSVTGVSVTQAEILASLKELQISDITLADNQLSIDGIVLSTVKAEEPMLEVSALIEQLKLQQLHSNLQEFQPQDLSISSLAINKTSVDAQQADTGTSKLTLDALQLDQIKLKSIPDTPKVDLQAVVLSSFNLDTFDTSRFVAFDRLALSKVTHNTADSSTALDSVRLQQLHYAPATEAGRKRLTTPYLFSMPSVTVNSIRADQNSAAIGTVDIEGGRLKLAIDKTGTINLVPQLAENGSDPETEAEADAEQVADTDKAESVDPEAGSDEQAAEQIEDTEAEAFNYQLTTLTFSKPFAIEFEDNSQSQPIKLGAAIKAVGLQQLTSDPDAEHSNFDTIINVDGQSDIAVKASIHPADTANFTLTTDIKHLELMTFSPYSEVHTGYSIDAGQMDLDLDVVSKANELDGLAEITIRKIDMRPVDQELAGSMQKQLTMPLPTALALLKDRKGNIKLDVPIEGNTQDPNFGVGSLINTLTMKALKVVTFSYVKKSLLPSSLLVDAASLFAGSIYNQMTALPPIAFQQNTALLQPDSNKILDNLATMMLEKGQMTVKVCPVVSVSEGVDDTARSLLAQQREQGVRDYLVTKGVKNERLMRCKADIKAESAWLVYLPMT